MASTDDGEPYSGQLEFTAADGTVLTIQYGGSDGNPQAACVFEANAFRT